MGGPVKISCLAINEICCSITDWFWFAGTLVAHQWWVISSSAGEQKRLKDPILHDLNPFYALKELPLLLWPIIRTSGILVSMLGGNFEGGRWQKACWKPWAHPGLASTSLNSL